MHVSLSEWPLALLQLLLVYFRRGVKTMFRFLILLKLKIVLILSKDHMHIFMCTLDAFLGFHSPLGPLSWVSTFALILG